MSFETTQDETALIWISRTCQNDSVKIIGYHQLIFFFFKKNYKSLYKATVIRKIYVMFINYVVRITIRFCQVQALRTTNLSLYLWDPHLLSKKLQ